MFIAHAHVCMCACVHACVWFLPCHTDAEAEYGQGDTKGSEDTDESVFWNLEVLPFLQVFETVTPGDDKTFPFSQLTVFE